MAVRPGRMNRRIKLYRRPTSTSDTGPYDHPLSPLYDWAQFQPLEPSFSDDTRTQLVRVTMRYRSDVTIDTHIIYADPVLGRDRWLLVKGVQNVDDVNTELVLFCEELVP